MLIDMELKISKQNFFNNIVEYLFAFILIINCNTMWTSISETVLNRVLKTLVIVIVAVYAILNYRILTSSFRCILIAAVIGIIYISIYSLIVRYDIDTFAYFVIDVFGIYAFIIIAKQNDRGLPILDKIVKIMIALAIISLFFWVFGSILGLIRPTGYTYFTWSGNGVIRTAPSYYGLYYETQNIYGIVRNTGLFTEAPMHSFALCIALIIELFCKSKYSISRCIILIITILTTFSTTGYCLIIISIVLKYIFSGKAQGLYQIIRVLIIPTIFVIGIIAVYILITARLGTNSGSTRIDDFVAGYKAWKEHPFFGAGFGNSGFIQQFMSSFRRNNLGFSNSPMQILAQGGIFLFAPYLYCAYKWIKVSLKKNTQWLVLFGCFVFIFTITVVSYKFLTIFMFMSYQFIEDSRCKNIKLFANKNKNI